MGVLSGPSQGMGLSQVSEEEIAIKAMFPANNKFQMLQMVTELQGRSVVSFSVLGVIRRRFKSQVLQFFEEEYRVNEIALDRKGRLEQSEIFCRRQLPSREDGDR